MPTTLVIKWVVIWGNPVDGIERIVGPFDDTDAAGDYAEGHAGTSTDYWFAEIEVPA